MRPRRGKREERYAMPAVKALIVDGGRAFVIRERRNAGQYGLPGGRVEFGEDPEQALRREVREETGLDIKIQQPLHMATIARKPDTHIVATVFRCRKTGGALRLRQEEVDGGEWMPLRRIREDRAMPQWIRDAVMRLEAMGRQEQQASEG